MTKKRGEDIQSRADEGTRRSAHDKQTGSRGRPGLPLTSPEEVLLALAACARLVQDAGVSAGGDCYLDSFREALDGLNDRVRRLRLQWILMDTVRLTTEPMIWPGAPDDELHLYYQGVLGLMAELVSSQPMESGAGTPGELPAAESNPCPLSPRLL